MSIRIKIKEIALSPGVGPYSIQGTSDVIESDGKVSQDLTKFTSALEEDTLDEKKTKKSKKVKADRKRQRKKAKKSAKKKDDRCTRIAKSKYKTWPSAYASGAVVRCRRGKIWKGLKEVLSEEKFKQHTMYNPETGKEEVAKTHEDHVRLAKKGFTHVDPEELRKVLKDEGGASGMDPFVKATKGKAEEKEIKDTLDDMPDVGRHKHGDFIMGDKKQIKVVKEGIRIAISETLDEKKKKKKKSKKKKAGTESSKEKHLGDWFDRQGGSGSEGGWVDCNTCRKNKKTGRTKCKKCGRDKGEKRAKYPACRPTPGACKERGRGESWGKKTAKGKKG